MTTDKKEALPSCCKPEDGLTLVDHLNGLTEEEMADFLSDHNIDAHIDEGEPVEIEVDMKRSEEKKIKLTFEGKTYLATEQQYLELWLVSAAGAIERRAALNRLAEATAETAQSVKGLAEAFKTA